LSRIDAELLKLLGGCPFCDRACATDPKANFLLPGICIPPYIPPELHVGRLFRKPRIRPVSPLLIDVAFLVRAPCQGFAPSARCHSRENCNSFAHSCINWKLVRSHEEDREQSGFLAHEPKSHALLQTRACSQSPHTSASIRQSFLCMH